VNAATAAPTRPAPLVRTLGRVAYESAWQAMREFTLARSADDRDEVWMLEHPPVYTLGVAGREEHLPRVDNGIPVVRIDRGGLITYHGPGQVVAYVLLDMRRMKITIRPLVRRLEAAVISVLRQYGVTAEGRVDAPGVYVGGAKIAALGLRIRNGCCYHGVALNVAMDLTPFQAINPCGYAGLPVTQMRDLGIADSADLVAGRLAQALLQVLA
jgi:lipoyl(octanoyl) transferase